MSACTCSYCGDLKIYKINCPTCGIDSPEWDLWCTCGDPAQCCPIHDTICPDCGEEMKLQEIMQNGKCDDCVRVYGSKYD